MTQLAKEVLRSAYGKMPVKKRRVKGMNETQWQSFLAGNKQPCKPENEKQYATIPK